MYFNQLAELLTQSECWLYNSNCHWFCKVKYQLCQCSTRLPPLLFMVALWNRADHYYGRPM